MNNHRPYIHFLVFWVGTKCSLKCKNCCNLIPYLKQDSYMYEENLKDLEFLSQNFDIACLQVQGGEPFTHKMIDQIIYAIGKLNIRKIEIASNGTILLNNKVLKALKENPHIYVRFSNYNCVEKRRQKVIEQLDANNISYKIYNFITKESSWFDWGGGFMKREKMILLHKKYMRNVKIRVAEHL